MRIERIKINNDDRVFEETFSKTDNLICILDNEKIYRTEYKNSFKKNMLDLFRVGSYVDGAEFFTETDISLSNGQNYTLCAKGEVMEENENGKQKGFTSIISRSYYNTESTNRKNGKKNIRKTKGKIEDIFDLSHSSSLICFEDDNYADINLFSDSFMWGKYDDKIISIAKKYFKEKLPLTFSNGDVLYMREPSIRNDNEWEVYLEDEHGGKYGAIYDSFGINLIFFITMNKFIQTLSNQLNEDFNYPIFILDVFDFVEEEYLDEIMKQLKELNKQVFIILRKPNKLIQNYCDKTVEYYYNSRK